ncbi:MAG: glutamate synthase subunit beta [Candidatus Omnitrophota bacterium]
MADTKGFLKFQRKTAGYRPVSERIKDFQEFILPLSPADSEQQATRCMDCGTPFCHWGCPVGNYIPEWNYYASSGKWDKAYQLLAATNNLPEITARICPAYCEYACVLGINDEPVTIRENELAIIEHAFKAGWVKPNRPARYSGKKIAVIGSGPAGLSCAAQLNSFGHKVTVFERDDKIGGILRYGIPDFKLEKKIIDRRKKIWEAEGIEFVTGMEAVEVKGFSALCLAAGCRIPRDLNIAGRDLQGIHFAMEFLTQANRRVAGEIIPADKLIDTKDKKVVVLGGGDTGADCVGVCHRQGAKCVVQIELFSQPPECRSKDYPWPKYPFLLKTSSSHAEGGERKWAVLTKRFIGENGKLKKLACVQVRFEKDLKSNCPLMQEVVGSEFEIAADMVILALGFLHPEKKGIIEALNLELDGRGNVKTDENFLTSRRRVFSCGDMRRGQSVVVWAISEGRQAAQAIDRYLNDG